MGDSFKKNCKESPPLLPSNDYFDRWGYSANFCTKYPHKGYNSYWGFLVKFFYQKPPDSPHTISNNDSNSRC